MYNVANLNLHRSSDGSPARAVTVIRGAAIATAIRIDCGSFEWVGTDEPFVPGCRRFNASNICEYPALPYIICEACECILWEKVPKTTTTSAVPTTTTTPDPPPASACGLAPVWVVFITLTTVFSVFLLWHKRQYLLRLWLALWHRLGQVLSGLRLRLRALAARLRRRGDDQTQRQDGRDLLEGNYSIPRVQTAAMAPRRHEQQPPEEMSRLLQDQQRRAGYFYTIDLSRDSIYDSGGSRDDEGAAAILPVDNDNSKEEEGYNARRKTHEAALKLLGRAKEMFNK